MNLEQLSTTSLRLLLVGLAGYGLLLVWGPLQSILLPFLVAILLATLLAPVVTAANRRLRVPRGLGAILAVLVLLVAVLGLIAVVIPDIISQAEEIEAQVERGVEQLPGTLRDLGLGDEQIQQLTATVLDRLQSSVGAIASRLSSGALTAAAGVASLASATFLAIVMLIYMLSDGDGFWRGLVRFAPRERRAAWDAAGRRAWVSLTHFVRSQVLVAFIDGVGIGVGLWILGVPLALPLGILTFVLAFLPYIGAVLGGIVAALVALATQGLDAMLGTIVLTLIVQQVEGNILFPLLIGRSVSLHPLTVVLGVGAGGALLGIAGSFLATPVIAAVGAAAGWIDPEGEGDEPVEEGERAAPLDHRASPEATPGAVQVERRE